MMRAKKKKLTTSPRPTRYPLPECVVPPGSSAEVFTSLPSMSGPFRPSWFCIPAEVAQHLIVTDIKVGKNSQFVAATCLPASLFASPAASYLRMDCLQGSMELRMSISNMTANPVKFSGEVIGHHADADDSMDPGALYICGLGYSLVEEVLDLRVQSQLDLKPRRLFVPDHVLEHLDVSSACVRPYVHGSRTHAQGNRTEEVVHSSDGPVVSVVGDHMLRGENLRDRGEIRLDPVHVVPASSFICLRVVNRSKKPQWFSGAILG